MQHLLNVFKIAGIIHENYLKSMTKTSKKFCLGDGGLNNHGFRLLMSGCDLTAFKDNPVMLNMHDDREVIGQWTNIEVGENAMYAEPDFDLEDPLAKEIARKVEKGYIKMCSMGVVPLEFSDAPELRLPGQELPTITRWKLREASIVPFGSNNRAMVQLYDDNGKPVNMANHQEIIRLMDDKIGVSTIFFNTNTTMKNVFKFFNLADNATEADALLAINNLSAEKVAAEKKVTELADKVKILEQEKTAGHKQEAAAIVDAAVLDGRVNADQKEACLKLFEANFDAAKIALAALTPRNPITGKIEAGKQEGAAELQELIKLSWDELDKGGKIARLKTLSVEQFREKFKSRFGKYPT